MIEMKTKEQCFDEAYRKLLGKGAQMDVVYMAMELYAIQFVEIHNFKDEYNEAVREIHELNRQLKEAENEIHGLMADLRNRQ